MSKIEWNHIQLLLVGGLYHLIFLNKLLNYTTFFTLFSIIPYHLNKIHFFFNFFHFLRYIALDNHPHDFFSFFTPKITSWYHQLSSSLIWFSNLLFFSFPAHQSSSSNFKSFFFFSSSPIFFFVHVFFIIHQLSIF